MTRIETPALDRTRRTLAVLLGAIFAVAAVPARASDSTAPPDRTLISRHADLPLLQPCLGAKPGKALRDFEPYAAVDPADPARIVAAWFTPSAPPDHAGYVAYAASADGGRTWTRTRPLALNQCAGGNPALAITSDPFVTAAPGHFYLSGIGVPVDASGQSSSDQVEVAASSDGGRTFAAPVAVFPLLPNTFYDNNSTAADPRPAGAGRVYAVTTRFAGTASDTPGVVAFARSTDAGKSWTAPQGITPAVPGESISAPQIGVDPRTGDLILVTYLRNPSGNTLLARRSTDFGTSWSDPVTITAIVGAGGLTRIAPGLRVNTAADIVSLAVDPATGALAVAYADQRGAGGSLQVSLTRSTDGGQTWTPPVPVSAAGSRQAFLPNVVFDAQGGLAVSYLDFRHWDGTSTTTLPTTVWLSAISPAGAITGEHAIETFDMRALRLSSGAVGTGDYQGLIAAPGGPSVVYVASTCRPGGPCTIRQGNPAPLTEVWIGH